MVLVRTTEIDEVCLLSRVTGSELMDQQELGVDLNQHN